MCNFILLGTLSEVESNVAENVLLFTSHSDPKSADGEEFGAEEGDIGVVGGARTMIGASRECIWFTHAFAWPMLKSEVKAGQVERPSSLSPIELLCTHEVLEILVVCENLELASGSFVKYKKTSERSEPVGGPWLQLIVLRP